MIAQSDETEMVEGNHYFPAASVDFQYLKDSSTTSHCPWKGEAHYHSLVVDGLRNDDAVWHYPDPYDAAKHISGHYAFWKGVEIDK